MKIIFEYSFEDSCYGIVSFKGARAVECELESSTETVLPPCKSAVKITTADFIAAELEFPDGRKLAVSTEKTPFTYSERYESFGDSRYRDLNGTVKVVE